MIVNFNKTSINLLYNTILALDSPRNTQLSPCGGTISIGSIISVSSDANPPVSSFLWIVDGALVSDSPELIVTEEIIGSDVEITCVVRNIMRGGPVSDSETCSYTVLGKTNN